MEIIRIHDRTFSLMIDHATIRSKILEMAQELNVYYEGKHPVLLPILTGGFRFAADLVNSLTFKYDLAFVKIASYGKSVVSSGTPDLLLAPTMDLANRDVLILDDISDSGNSLDFLVDYISAEKQAQEIRSAVLFIKTQKFKGTHQPDYTGFEVGNEFIVGYGLDYDEDGRYLNDVYRETKE